MARRGGDLVSILECDPDLGEDLSTEQFELARAAVLAPACSYPRGRWSVGVDGFDSVANLGLLIIKGFLVREVTVAEYTCAELLGPGDVVQPWLRIGPDHSVAADVGWMVAQSLDVGVLDRSFLNVAQPWPEITAAVSRRLMQRTHWLAFHLAVCALRRIDDRLKLVLWHFADRWGTVRPEGVMLDLPLTHELLAAVIGARRPSVSAAVSRLIDEDQIRPQPRSRWLLLGRPPVELRDLHQRRLRS